MNKGIIEHIYMHIYEYLFMYIKINVMKVGNRALPFESLSESHCAESNESQKMISSKFPKYYFKRKFVILTDTPLKELIKKE